MKIFNYILGAILLFSGMSLRADKTPIDDIDAAHLLLGFAAGQQVKEARKRVIVKFRSKGKSGVAPVETFKGSRVGIFDRQLALERRLKSFGGLKVNYNFA